MRAESFLGARGIQLVAPRDASKSGGHSARGLQCPSSAHWKPRRQSSEEHGLWDKTDLSPSLDCQTAAHS